MKPLFVFCFCWLFLLVILKKKKLKIKAENCAQVTCSVLRIGFVSGR